MEVLINNLQEKLAVTEEMESLITRVVDRTLQEKTVTKDGEVSIALVDNEYIHELNRKYRDKDKATDVLTFPMDDLAAEEEYVVLGDIIISLEKAREQAEDYGHSLERELAFLTVHGVLHLLGYDHEEESARELMEKEQDNILGLLAISR